MFALIICLLGIHNTWKIIERKGVLLLQASYGKIAMLTSTLELPLILYSFYLVFGDSLEANLLPFAKGYVFYSVQLFIFSLIYLPKIRSIQLDKNADLIVIPHFLLYAELIAKTLLSLGALVSITQL